MTLPSVWRRLVTLVSLTFFVTALLSSTAVPAAPAAGDIPGITPGRVRRCSDAASCRSLS